jgi:hypothetical protein
MEVQYHSTHHRRASNQMRGDDTSGHQFQVWSTNCFAALRQPARAARLLHKTTCAAAKVRQHYFDPTQEQRSVDTCQFARPCLQ